MRLKNNIVVAAAIDGAADNGNEKADGRQFECDRGSHKNMCNCRL